MGRSRTMNETGFAIYKWGIAPEEESVISRDLRSHSLSRSLYVRNCDRKVAGNHSCILTLTLHPPDAHSNPNPTLNLALNPTPLTLTRWRATCPPSTRHCSHCTT